MKYLFLTVAILFEVLGSSFMKVSDGFSKFIPTALTLLAYTVSFYFFAQTLKEMSLGVAYAIWSGVGIVLTAMVSRYVFKQSLDFPAILGMMLIVGGILVMNLFSKSTLQ